LAKVIILSPAPNQGHFDSWLTQLISACAEKNMFPLVIYPDTQIAKQIQEVIKGEEVHKPSTDKNNSYQFLNNVIRKFVRNNPRLSKFLRKSNILKYFTKLMPKYLSDIYNSNNNQIATAVALARIYDKKVKIVILYAESLAYIKKNLVSQLSKLNAEIHLMGFDLKKIPYEKIRKISNVKSLALTNIDSINSIRTSKSLLEKIRLYVLPDFHFESRELLDLPLESKIILLAGSITERKNLEIFLQAAMSDIDSNYEWRISGKIFQEAISSTSRRILGEISQSKPVNVTIRDEFLSDDELDREIQASSYLFLAYPDWKYGSNFLTNGVLYKKKIICLRNTYIADVATELGLAGVMQNSSKEDLFEALRNIKFKPNNDRILEWLAIHNSSTFKRIITEEILCN
jgi:hypothetical protein